MELIRYIRMAFTKELVEQIDTLLCISSIKTLFSLAYNLCFPIRKLPVTGGNLRYSWR
jgi:hypothetical protein